MSGGHRKSRVAGQAPTAKQRAQNSAFSSQFVPYLTTIVAVGLATLALPSLPAKGQDLANRDLVKCPEFEQNLVMPPELRSSGGILKGTINLIDEFRRFPIKPPARVGADCYGPNVRVFKGEHGEGNEPPPAGEPVPGFADAIPGPTLRARVGDIVQLTFVNKINPNNFDADLDRDACLQVGPGGNVYPGSFGDEHPNCLHASSTANIHFHGTHTTPNGTGDNVYLQVRPLPRQFGDLTTTAEEATAGFDEFFKACAEQLRNPLNGWPATWSDIPPMASKSWTDKQTELLIAYQEKNPGQALWDKNKEVLREGWPIYYIGAFPYCFALPAYTAETWPPPPGSTSPVMGQAPGTHWYHAHKHGSTAINVANGMTGAFIIEGKYDDDLKEAYRDYVFKDEQGNILKDEQGNNIGILSRQKVLVLNQLMDERHPHAMVSRPENRTLPVPGGVGFTVNGRLRPKVQMRPGEIQLWRIVNSSGRTAAYFMPPEGFNWQQIAQDGVQYAPARYIGGANLNKSFYMAPANRVDLLVRAPREIGKTSQVRVQNLMRRNGLDPDGPRVLLTVEVTGPAVERGDGQAMPVEGMQFLTESNAPAMPKFLQDITDDELKRDNYITRTLVFKSKAANTPTQHTINDVQFENGHAHLKILLGTTEEWTVVNETIAPGDVQEGPPNGPIDHPLHIHINPFQVTEVFDPNEPLMDSAGNPVIKNGVVLDRYTFPRQRQDDRQCELDPDDRTTWHEGGKLPRKPDGSVDQNHPCSSKKNLGWWDVFAIPSGKPGRQRDDGTHEVIPGYYKMRSRFVDYPGLYVMHCHILIHEDRGMMFAVEVIRTKSAPVQHH
jgi:FtsP/CotA-like multicopper oxidase with cupredoxin domain